MRRDDFNFLYIMLNSFLAQSFSSTLPVGPCFSLFSFSFFFIFWFTSIFPLFSWWAAASTPSVNSRMTWKTRWVSGVGPGEMRRVKVGIMNNYKRATTSVLGLKLFSYQMKFAITCVHRVNSPGHAMKMRLSVTWAIPSCAALTELP